MYLVSLPMLLCLCLLVLQVGLKGVNYQLLFFKFQSPSIAE